MLPKHFWPPPGWPQIVTKNIYIMLFKQKVVKVTELSKFSDSKGTYNLKIDTSNSHWEGKHAGMKRASCFLCPKYKRGPFCPDSRHHWMISWWLKISTYPNYLTVPSLAFWKPTSSLLHLAQRVISHKRERELVWSHYWQGERNGILSTSGSGGGKLIIGLMVNWTGSSSIKRYDVAVRAKCVVKVLALCLGAQD